MTSSIALIGPGRLGQAVTALLRQQGYPITAIVGRDRERTRTAARFIGAELMATTDLQRCAAATIIIIATPDDQLAATALQLQQQVKLHPDTMLVHCSGVHPAAIMKQYPSSPQPALAMHPLQTFASGEQGVKSLPGCFFSLEGEQKTIERGRQLVADLGGEAFTIEAQSKVLYHAAACMASNFVTTLLDSAGQILSGCNPEQQIPLAVLEPLVRAAVKNSLTLGTETALTGPIVRGDSGTIERHLEQIQLHQPHLVELYRHLGVATTHLAQRSQRLSDQDATQILEILK
ncbi:MAG: Rossmann-like and DUF2520 domain-containing protein [Thermodesulfobacteriota bacterium]|nr:Rossmann-like and DUF2520 domain-containing protein [Thermodesulfobacteriota bacterium]